MKHSEYKFKAKVWLYPGDTPWHFITVPPEESDDIDKNFHFVKRGWGSIRVTVTIGTSTWDTSIFPSKESGGYLLPLKASIRKAENIVAGKTVSLKLLIRES